MVFFLTSCEILSIPLFPDQSKEFSPDVLTMTQSWKTSKKDSEKWDFSGSILEHKEQKDSSFQTGTLLLETQQVQKKEGKKYIALSFDDGPGKKTTPWVLDILQKYKIHATFYILWVNAQYYPDILKRTYEEGHEIGNHSWDHQNFLSLDETGVLDQIKKTDDIVRETIGVTPTTLRPPYGNYNKQVSVIAQRPIILWNVDSFDWRNKKVDSNIANTLGQAKDGAIILMHDIHQASLDSLETIIQELQKQDYEFVTVSELLELYQTEQYIQKMCSSGYTCKEIP